MRKIVGKVTESEKKHIKAINSHKISLEELLLILEDSDELYKKAIDDLNNTIKKYQEWWDNCYSKYQWEKGKNHWTILFETNEIIINC